MVGSCLNCWDIFTYLISSQCGGGDTVCPIYSITEGGVVINSTNISGILEVIIGGSTVNIRCGFGVALQMSDSQT